MIRNCVLSTGAAAALLCAWDCQGMNENGGVDINVSSTRYPKEILDAILASSAVQKEISNLKAMLEKIAQDEYIACEEMSANDAIKSFADRISLTPNDKDCLSNIKGVIEEFMAFYNKADEFHRNLFKKAPDFDFCLGICGYYFSDENIEGTEKMRAFFKSVTGKDISQEIGINLIKASNGENAYWFSSMIIGK